jgi:chromosome condensin MukBEF ATPase and DNA-binding subunit MukB
MKASRNHIQREREEIRRQLRNPQLHRFVGSLASFAVTEDMPEKFLELLRELERIGLALDRSTEPDAETHRDEVTDG